VNALPITPEPTWNFQSSLPLFASRAFNQRSKVP
jgi:hypothetical protein